MFLIIFLLPIVSLADANVPSYITAIKKSGGPDGYNKVCQNWTGDDTGSLDCSMPGEIKCEWVVVVESSNGTNSVIDFSPLFDKALESFISGNESSMIFQIDNIQIHALVQEHFSNLEGNVIFYVYEV